MKKYSLKQDNDLFRIVAEQTFITGNGFVVNEGEFGGLVVSEDTLDQDGTCWIHRSTIISDPQVRICDDAYISHHCQITGNVTIGGSTIIAHNTNVHYGEERSFIGGNSCIGPNVTIDNRHGVYVEDCYFRHPTPINLSNNRIYISITREEYQDD